MISFGVGWLFLFVCFARCRMLHMEIIDENLGRREGNPAPREEVHDYGLGAVWIFKFFY